MKSVTRLLLASCALCAASVAFAAEKAHTFKVVGYYDRTQPAQELVAKAAAEVGLKMKACVSVNSEEDADQVIQVLFKQDGTYKIYWDALPLARQENRYRVFEKSDFNYWANPAESKGSESKPR